ncbi:MAG: UDP-N-acetylmuramate dehydrogenase [Flavobacteriales bacterium]
MITVEEDKPLKYFNSFGVAARARRFARVRSIHELQELITERLLPTEKLLMLGGGSNILFTEDWNGMVIKNEIGGIEVFEKENDEVWVKAGAGEVWHHLVEFCIENGLGGIENLSLIPGCVGAAPMQNIGAYGVELKDVFQSLEAFHIPTGTIETFQLKDCFFGYRDSIFKNKLKGEFIILSVTLRLSRKPVFNTSYGAIQSQLESMNVKTISIKAISKAVIAIRMSKLPSPADLGNAGSFFKNPEISREEFISLRLKFPDIVGYELPESRYKLAAGWLIEKAGWKGFRSGDYGVHQNQALVLVNYGNATGKEINVLADRILHSVKETFGVQLEKEVNVL